MGRLMRTIAKHSRGLHRLFALVLVTLSITACATSTTFRQGAPNRELQWPPLPYQTRVEWVKTIENYQDAGITKSFWKKIVEFVVGKEDMHIGKPYGVLCDDHERLFVVDVGLALVHVMDVKENTYYVIGGGDERIFRSPIGITEDDNENVYITDSAAGTVYRYSIREKTLRPFTSYKLGRPTGIAFNRNNRLLYVTDTASHQVIVMDLSGVERYRIGGRGDAPGLFNYPTDLFIDKQGRLYVTDALNSRIQIFSAEGALLKAFGKAGDKGGSFAKPKGVAVDSEGHIYVCDALFDAVQIFDDTGRFLLDFGGNGVNAGQFWMPSGLYIDKSDYIFVADTYNRRVQVFRYLKQ